MQGEAEPSVPVARVSNTELFVLQGDISRVHADALVNAANNRLWMGAGVAGALKRAGGAEVEREAVAKGPIEVGDAVSTTAGALPAKRVIHAAVMGQDLRTSAQIIRRATRRSLEVALDEGLRSVALPAFGTGVGGFPMEEAARQMLQAVTEVSRERRGLERIIFVLFEPPAVAVFKQVIGEEPGEPHE